MDAHSHIKQLRKQFGLFLLLLMIGAPMFIGCTVHRDLRISEVGLHAVELYLAEDSGNRLALADHTLMYKNSNGLEGEVDLGVFGTLPGGGWLVVWEEQNYSDPPEKADFVNFFGRSVPGIKVSDGFFSLPLAIFVCFCQYASIQYIGTRHHDFFYRFHISKV